MNTCAVKLMKVACNRRSLSPAVDCKRLTMIMTLACPSLPSFFIYIWRNFGHLKRKYSQYCRQNILLKESIFLYFWKERKLHLKIFENSLATTKIEKSLKFCINNAGRCVEGTRLSVYHYISKSLLIHPRVHCVILTYIY